MPASPFGLAYGLGAGIAGGQQQMQARQQQATQLALQNAQLQQAQFQMAQQRAMNEAMSQPVAPETQSVTQTQPGFESAAAANQTLGGMKGPGGEDLTLNAPTETVQKPVQYTTPYQKMAYEMAQRAQMLQNKGFGLSAMQLQQQALQYHQMHMDTARGQAVQALVGGDYQNAINNMHSMGMTNVTNVGRLSTNNGQEMFYAQDNQGNKTLMTRDDLAALAADPSKMSQIMAEQGRYQAMLNAWGVRSENSLQATRERVQAQKEIATQRNQTALDVANIRASVPAGMRGATTTADEKNVAAYMRDHPGATASEAWDRIRPTIQARGQITDKDRLRNLTARNAEIRKNLGGAPSQDDPEYQEYMDNQGVIQGLIRPGKKATAPATPAGPDVNAERKMAAAAIAANPNAADKIKAAFKARTQQDY